MTSESPLEIERKWLVDNWPDNIPLLMEQNMKQGYITVRPTVRIREENTIYSQLEEHPVKDEFVLCFKSEGTLSRKEIEIRITENQFEELEDLISITLIPKIRRTYLLSNGAHLEVNLVDKGLSTSFMYAEVEFSDEETARSFNAQDVNMADYLSHEVTGVPGESMGAYWERTRLN